MAKQVKKEDTKTPKEASNIFHNIMKASVTVKPKQEVKKKEIKK